MRVQLVKHETEDGLMSFLPEVALGTVYEVNPVPMNMRFFHAIQRVFHNKQVYTTAKGYIPVECVATVKEEVN